jgi:HTH-type transcriptional regulator/antitoxin HipB
MSGKFSRSGMVSESCSKELGAIASAVRAARRRYGLTQAQLAGLSGTGLRFISELERGKPSISLHKLLPVLAVLGLQLQVVEAS